MMWFGSVPLDSEVELVKCTVHVCYGASNTNLYMYIQVQIRYIALNLSHKS